MHSKQDHDIIQAEIDKLLRKGVIIPTRREKGDFVSSVFTRKKKDDTYRTILNLKKFNSFLVVPHCKLESIEDALNLITQGCYFASVDLKDAYYSVPINKDFQKFLKLYFDEMFFQFVVLPNGFAPAVQNFTKIMIPPFRHLRSKGHLSVKYLDDSLLIGESVIACLDNVIDTIKLLRNLGFTIHPEKSVLTPTQKITFLGFILDSVKMTITLTKERKEKIYGSCTSLLDKDGSTVIRELAQTIGNLVSAFRAVPYGQLYYRGLEDCKIKALKISKGNFDKPTQLTAKALNELIWWKNNIMSSFAPIKLPDVEYTIYSDASLEGWGGTDGQEEIGGRWGKDEKISHINSLELLAAFFCLKSFCKNKTDIHVMLKIDNTTAVAYINKKGGTVSKSCNERTFEIWSWAIQHNIWLSASHVPGLENHVADLKSRHFNDNKEWSLNPKMFKLLCQTFGRPEIDLFATRLNSKCQKYVSYKPDPNATDVDAFSMNWGKIKGYIFSPFSLIGRVLAKIQRDQARVLVIVPCWQTRPWFPQFVRMVDEETEPVLLKAHRRLLLLPGTEQSHPLSKTLNLIAARLSGASKGKNYHLESRISSWHHGDQEQEPHTTRQCNDGWISAEDGAIIPSTLL